MKETLERLWNEYLAAECSVINTEEERTLVKKAFFYGCEFTISFFFESGSYGKR